MKKNIFYTILQEEFSLLENAVSVSDADRCASLAATCEQRHNALCRHLLRDFVTPLNREDLYGLSAAILAVFPLLSVALTAQERSLLVQCISLLSADPFRLDETVLRRKEQLKGLLSQDPSPSPRFRDVGEGLFRVCDTLVLVAIRNA